MRQGELAAVEALYAMVFGDASLALWRRRYEWQFRSNPANAHRAAQMWVGVRGQEIVGFLASFPARLKVLESEMAVLCPCDLMVSPRARGERLGERLLQAYIADAGGLAMALAYSPGAAALYDRLGYRRVYAEPVYLRPLRGRRIVRSLAASRFTGGSALHAGMRFAMTLAGPLAAAAVTLANAIRSPQPIGDVTVRIESEFGVEYDLCWAEAAKELPVAFVRDSSFLSWRFTRDPITHHSVFAARDAAGALLGYAAVCETTRRGLRVGKIMDVLCSPSVAERIVGPLTAALLLHFRDAGFDVVSAKGLHPSIRAALERYLYLKSPGDEMPARFLVPESSTFAEVLYSSNRWHLSHADGDEDFVP